MNLRERVLRGEKKLLFLEKFIIARLTAAITLVGDFHGFLVSGDGAGLKLRSRPSSSREASASETS